MIVCAAILVADCGGGGERDTVAGTGPATGSGGGDATVPGVGKGTGGVRLEKLGDFEAPLYVTQPPDSEDLYVVEQGGTVRIVRDGETLSKPFLDITDQVTANGEQGLLSIAFAPDYPDSHLVYAYYTDLDQNQRVVEFRAPDGDAVDPDSERLVLEMDDFAGNHNGGLLLFGPDGHLYIGTGDGGIADDPKRNGQDLSSLLGKILRIDPQRNGDRAYSVPPDNPFVDREGARPEVYAYGLRNPWRFSFDRENDQLTIGDVGQNEWEEIDIVPAGEGAGANFGWSAFEADQRFNDDQTAPDAVFPVLAYSHDDGCSVTGGLVVRDRQLRSLYGRYLYGDYCAGELRSFIPESKGAADDRALGLEVPQLSSFGEDLAGHVYATSLDGPVYRLAPG